MRSYHEDNRNELSSLFKKISLFLVSCTIFIGLVAKYIAQYHGF